MLSPVVVSRINRKYTKNDLYTVLIRELDEVQNRLTSTSYILGVGFGRFDREFLMWCRSIYETYQGGEGRDKSIQAIDRLLSLTDDQLNDYLRIERSDPNKGLGLKRTILTFSELNLADISVFSHHFQNSLFELRARVINHNQEIDRIEKMHFMTFDSSLTSENHQIIKADIYAKYAVIQEMAVKIVDKIDEIKSFEKY